MVLSLSQKLLANSMDVQPALVVSDLRKRYGPTIALDGLSLLVRSGAVHALLGENGAGKSTLVRLLSGLTQPDDGSIAVFDESVRIDSPKDAHRLGIRTAFQEISLIKDLSVSQNFLLMEEPLGASGMIRQHHRDALVSAQLARLGLGHVDVRAEVVSLDLPTRQKIEIARAISHSPRILLLDEPTASLSARDVDWLGAIIERLTQAGTTIIFISHRLQEVRRLCSALTILRNGRVVGSYDIHAISDNDVIEFMIGRSISAAFPSKPSEPRPAPSAPPALAVHDLRLIGVNGVSLNLWPRRITGLGGLDGMGQRELFLALFGLAEIQSGSVFVNGQEVTIGSPADAISGRIGISMVPEDRKAEGLFLELDGRQNVSLPSLSRFTRWGLVNYRAEDAAVRSILELVKVVPRALWSLAREFSGGNQQKIVFAKWLLAGSRILLLYDPTRGVDVGTKAELYHLIREFAAAGGAVLYYSTDIPELVNLCDEVAVIYRGQIAVMLEEDAISETRIMAAAVAQSSLATRAAKVNHVGSDS
jgi:ribose transport system ATP-binding protein